MQKINFKTTAVTGQSRKKMKTRGQIKLCFGGKTPWVLLVFLATVPNQTPVKLTSTNKKEKPGN